MNYQDNYTVAYSQTSSVRLITVHLDKYIFIVDCRRGDSTNSNAFNSNSSSSIHLILIHLIVMHLILIHLTLIKLILINLFLIHLVLIHLILIADWLPARFIIEIPPWTRSTSSCKVDHLTSGLPPQTESTTSSDLHHSRIGSITKMEGLRSLNIVRCPKKDQAP